MASYDCHKPSCTKCNPPQAVSDTPRTEAGKALVQDHDCRNGNPMTKEHLRLRVRAIEAEARDSRPVATPCNHNPLCDHWPDSRPVATVDLDALWDEYDAALRNVDASTSQRQEAEWLSNAADLRVAIREALTRSDQHD